MQKSIMMAVALLAVVLSAGVVGAQIGQRQTFAPNDNITRAEAITMIYRAMGEPEHNINVGEVFSDVDPQAYYAAAVGWAWETGVTNGKGVRDCYPEYTWDPTVVDRIAEREANECIVYDVAVKWNISTADFGRVAFCESKFLGNEKNPNSSATGVFQFLVGTWEWIATKLGVPYPNGDRNNPLHSAENAAFLWTLDPGGGPQHWECY